MSRAAAAIDDAQALLRSTPSFLGARIGDLEDLKPGSVALAGVFCDHFGGAQPGSRFAPRQLRYVARCRVVGAEPRARNPGEGVIDVGDLNVFPLQPMRNARTLGAQSEQIASAGAKLLAIGGDYSVTPHLIEGLVRAHRPMRIGMIRLSRRLDFYNSGGSLTRADATLRISGLLGGNGSNIALIGAVSPITNEEKANAAAAHIIPMHAITAAAIEATVATVATQCDACYLSVDADALSPLHGETSSPRTGAGMLPSDLLAVLGGLAQMPFVGADVMGHVPDLDVAGTTSTSMVSCIVHSVADLLLGAPDVN